MYSFVGERARKAPAPPPPKGGGAGEAAPPPPSTEPAHPTAATDPCPRKEGRGRRQMTGIRVGGHREPGQMSCTNMSLSESDWLKWCTTFEIAQEFSERGQEFIERGRGKILEGVALGLLDVSGVGRVRGDSQKTHLSR